MSAKTVCVEAVMGGKFKLTSTIGKHTLHVDQPEMAGGTGAGPTPLEYFLLSLAGCISTIGRIVANQKKIPLRSMVLKVQGELDTDVLLGKNNISRAGFSPLNVRVDIDADLTHEEKEAFLKEVELRCPISDNILNATPLEIVVS